MKNLGDKLNSTPLSSARGEISPKQEKSRDPEKKLKSLRLGGAPAIQPRLFFAGIAQFGDDFLAHHLGAVIKHFNKAGAGGAGIGHSRS
ncbi:MAG: hypothetical protein WA672_13510, partial [Candidatus Angelobacter sp.]